jgi:hypothetical protein
VSNYIEFDADAWASMKERDPEEMIYMINLLKFRDTVEDGLGVDGRKGRDVWMNKYGAGVNAVAERLDTGLEVVVLNDAHATMLGLPGEEWDMIALVRYRTRANFIEMIEDQEYPLKYRNGSLENSRLIECVTDRPDDYPSTLQKDKPTECLIGNAHANGDDRMKSFRDRDADQPIFMLNLIRCKAETDSGVGLDGTNGAAGYDAYNDAMESDYHEDVGMSVPWKFYPRATIVGPQDEQWDQAFLVSYPSRKVFRDMVTDSNYRTGNQLLRDASVLDSRLIETTPVVR